MLKAVSLEYRFGNYLVLVFVFLSVFAWMPEEEEEEEERGWGAAGMLPQWDKKEEWCGGVTDEGVQHWELTWGMPARCQRAPGDTRLIILRITSQYPHPALHHHSLQNQLGWGSPRDNPWSLCFTKKGNESWSGVRVTDEDMFHWLL